MADINSGQPVRWENGGAIKIDTGTSYAALHAEAGTLRFQPGLKQREAMTDRGAYTGVVLEGDERMSRIEITAKCTATSFDATNLVKLARSSSSSGAITKFILVVDIPDYRGGGGKRITFNDCFMPDGEQYQAAGAGATADTIALVFMSLDSEPTETDYT